MNLWIPTYKSGLLLIRPISKKIITDNKLMRAVTSPLESAIVDDRGSLWFGSEDGKVFFVNNNSVEQYGLPKNSNPICRILDIDSYERNAALITSDQGMYLFDNKKFFEVFDAASKNADYSDGNFLVSSYNCVFTVSLDYLQSLDKSLNTATIALDDNVNILNNSRSYANSFGSAGELWFASETDGLIKNQEGKRLNFGSISNKLKSSIRDIIPLEGADIAVASAGEGILVLSSDDYFSISRAEGLSSDIVHCLAYENGKLYAGTNRGLNIIDITKGPNNIDIEHIDRSIGLATDEINDIAILNDTIYLATHDGLLLIEDKYRKEETKNKKPFIQINEVLVNDEPISIFEKIDLEPHQNNIIIRYTAINPAQPAQFGYAYNLTNVDEELIFTQSRETHYSNLLPGKYTFGVGVADNNELITELSSIEFEIQESFIQSDLFKVISALVILTIVGFFLYSYNALLQKSKLKNLVDQRTKELDEKVKALEVVNIKMEQSNEALKNYAHITSHDLKSPLRNVGSFVQLLEKKNAATFDSKDQEYVKYVRDGVKSMENTIDDLLTYSSLEKSEPYRPVPILDVINQVITDLALTISDRNVKIKVTGEYPTLDGHFSRYKRLFQNLIENGIKYNSSENPQIEISVVEDEAEYKFTIADNGIGFDQKYSDKIFEMFQRLHDRSSYSGTGIGLAMCKKIIESYGGKIWVESEYGSGSQFHFVCPK